MIRSSVSFQSCYGRPPSAYRNLVDLIEVGMAAYMARLVNPSTCGHDRQHRGHVEGKTSRRIAALSSDACLRTTAALQSPPVDSTRDDDMPVVLQSRSIVLLQSPRSRPWAACWSGSILISFHNTCIGVSLHPVAALDIVDGRDVRDPTICMPRECRSKGRVA